MANAMTEHSKKLRAESAARYNKKAIAEGLVKRMTIQAASEIIDEFDAICTELSLSRPQAIKYLTELYRHRQ